MSAIAQNRFTDPLPLPPTKDLNAVVKGINTMSSKVEHYFHIHNNSLYILNIHYYRLSSTHYDTLHILYYQHIQYKDIYIHGKLHFDKTGKTCMVHKNYLQVHMGHNIPRIYQNLKVYNEKLKM